MNNPRVSTIAAIALLSLASLSTTGAQDKSAATTLKSAIAKHVETYKPTMLPDRVVLTWAGDPRTTQAVTWRTSTAVDHAIAELAIADAGPNFPAKAKQLLAQTERLQSDLSDAHYHSVQFVDLLPATKYVYRVGDGVNWSEWFHFRTASDKPESFSFIYLGDAQNSIRSLWSRVIRGAYSDAPQSRFIIHAGDLITTAESDAEWGEWFGAGGWINGMVPSVPVPGNHEQAKAEDKKLRLTKHWRPQFTLLENGPPTLPETCYTFEYQNCRIIALNSNEQIDVQTAWLESVLHENKSPWIVCTFHHPIYSSAKDRDNAALRAAWKPLFDKYHVDLVLQGHDHTYGRTGLEVPAFIEPVKKADEKASVEPVATVVPVPAATANDSTGQAVTTGTVYVVSVSGPKMYNNQRQPFMKRVAEDTQLYQIIRIEGDRLHFEARTATGEIYDCFELQKQPGTINRLTEIAPEIEARMRLEKKSETKEPVK
ncbi:MAG: metallophosphoesterase family protein [Pirellulales bacterium]